MTHTVIQDIPLYETNGSTRSVLEKWQARWRSGLLISAIMTVLCAIGAIGTNVVSFMSNSGQKSIADTFETILIVAAMAFLVLAAHCLDKSAELEKASRLEYCRQNGLREESGRQS